MGTGILAAWHFAFSTIIQLAKVVNIQNVRLIKWQLPQAIIFSLWCPSERITRACSFLYAFQYNVTDSQHFFPIPHLSKSSDLNCESCSRDDWKPLWGVYLQQQPDGLFHRGMPMEPTSWWQHPPYLRLHRRSRTPTSNWGRPNAVILMAAKPVAFVAPIHWKTNGITLVSLSV